MYGILAEKQAEACALRAQLRDMTQQCDRLRAVGAVEARG